MIRKFLRSIILLTVVSTVLFLGLFFFNSTESEASYINFLGKKEFIYEANKLANIATVSVPSDISSYAFSKPTWALSIGAGSYLVVDLGTKEIIINKDSSKAFPIASLTKLMTALVAIENINLSEKATVSSRANKTYGNRNKLKTGQQIKIEDLLHALLLESSNASSEVIAEHFGRDNFLSAMNKKAEVLGMNQTIFDDPSGLSANNISSAEDLIKLIDYVYHNQKKIFEITKEGDYKTQEISWRNLNNITKSNYYEGGKIGFTDEAKQTLISLFEIPMMGEKNRLVALVLLASDNRRKDTKDIIEYLATYVQYNGQ